MRVLRIYVQLKNRVPHSIQSKCSHVKVKCTKYRQEYMYSWYRVQYVAKNVCSEATRTLRLASQRLRGFMIIKTLQEGLPELLREATRSGQTF